MAFTADEIHGAIPGVSSGSVHLRDWPVVPESWKDVSWRNEVAPCWSPDNGERVFVFVDHWDAAQREFPETSRFSVHFVQHIESNCVFASDSWPAILAFVGDIDWSTCDA